MKKVMVQFIKFGIVGVSNTLISYVTYMAGITWGLHYLLANLLAFVVSVINSYYWNSRYVFKQREGERRSKIKAFAKTVLSYAGTGLLLNSILLAVQVDMLGVAEWLAPLINLIITVPLNFILNKLWAFRTEENRTGEVR